MSKAILYLDKMPGSCDECYCYYFREGKCLVKDRLVDSDGVVNKRPNWCPLVEATSEDEDDGK